MFPSLRKHDYAISLRTRRAHTHAHAHKRVHHEFNTRVVYTCWEEDENIHRSMNPWKWIDEVRDICSDIRIGGIIDLISSIEEFSNFATSVC